MLTPPRGPLLSGYQETPYVIAGTYNAVPPAPADGQQVSLQTDYEGNLLVNNVGGGGHSALNPQNPLAPGQVVIGAATTSVLSANPNRTGLVLTNASSNIISIGLGAAAVLNSGITLTPFGVWVMDGYTFTTVAINAIASAAGSALAVQEFS